MVISKTRVVACIIVLVVVIWYVISFQHVLLGSHLKLTSITDNPSHQQTLRSDSHTSTCLPTVTPTLHQEKIYEMSDYIHTTPQVRLPKWIDSTFQLYLFFCMLLHCQLSEIKAVAQMFLTLTTFSLHKSYSMEAWESIMRDRLARVAWVCQQHARVLQRFDLFNVFKSLTVDPAHHLVYCRNAKVMMGSRDVLWSFVFQNMTFSFKVLVLKALENYICTYNFELSRICLLQKNWYVVSLFFFFRISISNHVCNRIFQILIPATYT